MSLKCWTDVVRAAAKLICRLIHQLPPAGRSCFTWSDATEGRCELGASKKIQFVFFLCQERNLVLAAASGLFGALRDFRANTTARQPSRVAGCGQTNELRSSRFYFFIFCFVHRDFLARCCVCKTKCSVCRVVKKKKISKALRNVDLGPLKLVFHVHFCTCTLVYQLEAALWEIKNDFFFFFSVVCQAQSTCLVTATVIYLKAEWKKVPRSAAVVQAPVAVALALPWQPRSKQGFA